MRLFRSCYRGRAGNENEMRQKLCHRGAPDGYVMRYTIEVGGLGDEFSPVPDNHGVRRDADPCTALMGERI